MTHGRLLRAPTVTTRTFQEQVQVPAGSRSTPAARLSGRDNAAVLAVRIRDEYLRSGYLPADVKAALEDTQMQLWRAGRPVTMDALIRATSEWASELVRKRDAKKGRRE